MLPPPSDNYLGRSCCLKKECYPSALFVAGLAPTIAFDVELEDRRMMYEPVNGGHCHARVREHVIPAGESLFVDALEANLMDARNAGLFGHMFAERVLLAEALREHGVLMN